MQIDQAELERIGCRVETFGDATLYLGDCREVMRVLPNESVNIIWTDPPYGHNNNNNGDLIHKREKALGKAAPKHRTISRPILNDGMAEMNAVVDSALIEAVRVLKRDCCCCCCCGGGGPVPTFAWVAQRMDTKGLSFFHAVVWDKGGLGMGWRYRRNYEFVMVAHRKGGKIKWETDRADSITANVVRIPKIIPKADNHPTPKPKQLPAHFLMLHGKRGDVVLDPFMGHAPAGVAALDAGMRYIGIEQDPEHFERACDRIDQAQRQTQLPF